MKFLKIIDKNQYGRDFVVGDLHGCYEIFQKELKLQAFDPEVDRIFSVGDLVDRGPDSFSCLTLLEEDWFNSVKGNHEVLWLDAHKFWFKNFDDCTVDDRINLEINFKIFLKNGGEIIDDYATYIRFKELIEELPSIIELNHHSGKRFGILHAELPMQFTDWNVLHEMSEEEMNNTLSDNLYWGRTRIKSTKLVHPPIENVHRIYVGHTIQEEVFELGNIRYIDTGAFMYDKLTMELIK